MDVVAPLLDVPGAGLWQARNSPVRRIPSHGTDAFGSSHAIDLVPVDARGRSGPIDWRTLLGTEDPARFVGWGRPVTAPVAGIVVLVHDGEPDARVRRSLPAYIGFARTQPVRVRRGLPGLAGNSVVLAVADGGPYVLIAHLRNGTVAVTAGQQVVAGQLLGGCGNSGNSTQPHVHLQLSDSTDWTRARGLPFAFTGYRTGGSVIRAALPGEAQVVEAVVDPG
ncbi:MAG: M23 family metallopeptidase [Micropruina sp.]|uniref:peptidoglycan DD-metalloendopeptidase family protein n=1 Tax=Micropruina sp. TaxID=2737536 RepID=UPI0039E2D111